MARALRIEYPGAVYHVTARGNQGNPIFKDDHDRRTFLETLAEACEKTGWRVHAYVLMRDHYHLLLETPEANLVAGMKWLQGTYTQRYNARHRQRGHLFQGRYKAVVVDGEEELYFQIVSTYIHLNPARAKLIRFGQQRLKTYSWSSYSWYLKGGRECPAWLERSRVMGSLGLKPKEGKRYEAYLEGRVLELMDKGKRKEVEAEWRSLRRGWYVGEKEFGSKLVERLKKLMKRTQRESHSGLAKAAHDDRAAEKLLEKGLKALKLREAALKELPKGAPEKVVLASLLRERTTVSLRWISGRLAMGCYTRVSQAQRRSQHERGKKLQQLRRTLAKLDDDNETR